MNIILKQFMLDNHSSFFVMVELCFARFQLITFEIIFWVKLNNFTKCYHLTLQMLPIGNPLPPPPGGGVL